MRQFYNCLFLSIFIVSLDFVSSAEAQEYRLRAHHIFWKNQEAGTEKEIDFLILFIN